jgi:hypothetical protein
VRSIVISYAATEHANVWVWRYIELSFVLGKTLEIVILSMIYRMYLYLVSMVHSAGKSNASCQNFLVSIFSSVQLGD